MDIKTLSSLRLTQIPRDNWFYGFTKVGYRGLIIRVWKSSFDGTYAYESMGGKIKGTHYSSLSSMKKAIREEVDELEKRFQANIT